MYRVGILVVFVGQWSSWGAPFQEGRVNGWILANRGLEKSEANGSSYQILRAAAMRGAPRVQHPSEIVGPSQERGRMRVRINSQSSMGGLG